MSWAGGMSREEGTGRGSARPAYQPGTIMCSPTASSDVLVGNDWMWMRHRRAQRTSKGLSHRNRRKPRSDTLPGGSLCTEI